MSGSATNTSADFLFAGGGLAGLSLAWHIAKAFPGKYTMIIADKEIKNGNDRTWCFWEKGDGPFEDVVLRKWDHLRVEGPAWQRILDIDPYRYKMVRSRDLYAFIHRELQAHAGIHFVYGEISQPREEEHGVSFLVDQQEYRGKWMVNSALRPKIPPGYPRYLLQHFKGYFLKTDEEVFDPDIPLFMDFRVPQSRDVRFVYVMPFSPKNALVEFTVFSPELWQEEAYRAELTHYLNDILKIGTYEILEEEFGVIPMTDYPFPRRSGKRILHAGTAGGMTKASTGFTFVNVQRENMRIIEALRHHGTPFPGPRPWHWRYLLYDSILLDVLANNRYPGRDIFKLLFHANDPSRILAFLGEESRFADELRLFTTFPQLPFIQGFLTVMKDRMLR